MTSVLRRYKWLLAAVLVLLIAAAIYLALLLTASDVKFKATDDQLIISNPLYEIAFDREHGSIIYLHDKKATVGNMDLQNRAGALWWAFLDDETPIDGSKADFSYSYNRSNQELTFHYKGQLDVDVVTSFAEDNRIQMNANVINTTEGTLSSFRFPYELKLSAKKISDGLLPMLPGAKLTSAFFQENNSYQAQYPGIMFAAYVGIRTEEGNFSLYDLQGSHTATMELGFKNQVDDPGKTALVHNYKTWIKPTAEWSSPTVVLEVGGDYQSSIASYRELSGIAEYASLDKKLGADKEKVLQLPFLKLDISALQQEKWKSLISDVVDRLPYPGILHLVGFQQGGHDENYPDFIPPDAKFGTEEEFRAFIADAKKTGNLVVPYTNFSWWGNHAPTLQSLPNGLTLDDIVVQKQTGAIIKEDYGSHSGYVMNIAHPYVQQRIAEEHKKLLDAGMDGIFEDQWGIRDVPFVYNPELAEGTDPSTSYYAGMKEYFASLKHHMYTEDGFDSLADDSLGFMGTNYLWDLLKYRPNTASYTEYYPMIGMLVRDKVQLYQHNLAAETMTDDKEMLRWNVAMGYNLSADLFNGTDSPWVDLVGVFQKYVLAPYGDALVKSYEQVTPTVTRTDFGDYSVTASWNTEETYAASSDFTLAESGFEILANELKVRAGAYTRYNGQDLDAGDHILVELREGSKIRIFQPVGADTTITVAKEKDWPHATATAYQADGTKIADLPIVEQGDDLSFDYIASILDQKTGYISLERADEPSAVKAAFTKVKVYTNLAIAKKIVASSVTTDDFPPTFANDGDPYTYWESTAKKFPQMLTLDLGVEQEIGKVALKLPPQTAWEARDQIVEISGSTDGDSFQVLAPEQTFTFDPTKDNIGEIVLKPTKTRYVRLTVSGNTAWPAAQISEFEVFGPDK
ncbi:MAG: discoidin domain-containing protein [Gorillibacterium sp.]|nr:discoidin domain-containing protein [Gorillibacterium sp.]